MKTKNFFFILIYLFIFYALFAVPNTINFQGALKDANGQPVNASVDITFRIYDTETGGSPIWEETQNAVQILNGIFSVELGTVTPLSAPIFENEDLWITFRVSGDTSEMSPRKKVNAVPFAYRSQDTYFATIADTAHTLDGISINHLVQKDSLGNASISGTMTADAFVGDGSGLTGITSIYDNNYIHTTGPDTMNANSGLPTLTINNSGIGIGLKINSAGNDGVSLNNITNDGVHISSAGDNGIHIERSDNFAVRIDSTGNDGIYIRKVGNPSTIHSDSTKAGLEVAGSSGYGVAIGQSDMDGLFIYKVGNPSSIYSGPTQKEGIEIQGTQGTGEYIGVTGQDGFFVSYPHNSGFGVYDAGTYGFWVNECTNDGLYVQYADGDGINVNTTDSSGEYGVYTPDKIHGSNLTTRTINNIGLNTGNQELEPGDIVALTGYQDDILKQSNIPLLKVEKANRDNSSAIIGVVEYKVYVRERTVDTGTPNSSTGGKKIIEKSFRHAERNAYKGEYVSIVVLGPADVKIDTKENIKIGEKLTVSQDNAKARPIKETDNWTIGILGKALENSNGKDKIKVYVNCK